MKEPGDQAGASPVTGVVPPKEYRFKPGQSGNPSGHGKGYYSISQAQTDFLQWPWDVVKVILQEGLDGENVPKVYRRRLKPAHDLVRARWIAGRSPEMPWGNAAVEQFLDRQEGKVKSTTDLNVSAPDLASFFLGIAGKQGSQE